MVPGTAIVASRSSASTFTEQPSVSSSWAMNVTSRMPGTCRSVVVPSASSAAAISLSTLFFAPATSTVPSSRASPAIRNRSTGRL
jgi:hypothetical protein